MNDENNNSLIKFEATKLDIKFPDNDKLKKEEKEKIEKGIKKGGIATNQGKCFIEKSTIKTQLCTDKKGENRFYNNLDDDDKLENGKKKYAAVSAVSKEINERIQQPRDALIHEKLRHSEECLKAFRDNPKLVESRLIEEARIEKQLPSLTKKKMKAENIDKCQLSGKEFNNDAEGHHVVRKADDPTKACDLNNIAVVKGEVHDTIHKENAESKEELEALCKRKGWNYPYKNE